MSSLVKRKSRILLYLVAIAIMTASCSVGKDGGKHKTESNLIVEDTTADVSNEQMGYSIVKTVMVSGDEIISSRYDIFNYYGSGVLYLSNASDVSIINDCDKYGALHKSEQYNHKGVLTDSQIHSVNYSDSTSDAGESERIMDQNNVETRLTFDGSGKLLRGQQRYEDSGNSYSWEFLRNEEGQIKEHRMHYSQDDSYDATIYEYKDGCLSGSNTKRFDGQSVIDMDRPIQYYMYSDDHNRVQREETPDIVYIYDKFGDFNHSIYSMSYHDYLTGQRLTIDSTVSDYSIEYTDEGFFKTVITYRGQNSFTGEKIFEVAKYDYFIGTMDDVRKKVADAFAFMDDQQTQKEMASISDSNFSTPSNTNKTETGNSAINLASSLDNRSEIQESSDSYYGDEIPLNIHYSSNIETINNMFYLRIEQNNQMEYHLIKPDGTDCFELVSDEYTSSITHDNSGTISSTSGYISVISYEEGVYIFSTPSRYYFVDENGRIIRSYNIEEETENEVRNIISVGGSYVLFEKHIMDFDENKYVYEAQDLEGNVIVSFNPEDVSFPGERNHQKSSKAKYIGDGQFTLFFDWNDNGLTEVDVILVHMQNSFFSVVPYELRDSFRFGTTHVEDNRLILSVPFYNNGFYYLDYDMQYEFHKIRDIDQGGGMFLEYTDDRIITSLPGFIDLKSDKLYRYTGKYQEYSIGKRIYNQSLHYFAIEATGKDNRSYTYLINSDLQDIMEPIRGSLCFFDGNYLILNLYDDKISKILYLNENGDVVKEQQLGYIWEEDDIEKKIVVADDTLIDGCHGKCFVNGEELTLSTMPNSGIIVELNETN